MSMETDRQLEEQVAQLSREVEHMRSRMRTLEVNTAAVEPIQANSNRRGFLRLAAGAAIGAMGLAAGKVLPTAAATGTPTTAGNSFTEENSLFISDDSGGGTAVPVFGAKAKGFDSTAQTNAGSFVGPLQGLG